MSNIEIGFTQFMDFVVRKDTPGRVTAVRGIKYQAPYHPTKDFWKRLRDQIEALHKNGYPDDYLDDVLTGLNEKKIDNYVSAICGYKKFLKSIHRRQVEWCDLSKSYWAHDRLYVRSTPELGLIIDGQTYRIKLFFKDYKQRVDKRQAFSLLTMMEDSITAIPCGPETNCILKVHAGKLIGLDNAVTPTSRIALQADAIQFVSIHDQV